MTNAERFEDARNIWSETLAPETAVERRLVNFIACQDWLLYRTMLRAIAAGDPREATRYELQQSQLADSIQCLIDAVTTLQKSRRNSDGDAPPPVSAKVIEMPRRRPAGFGRPSAIQLDLDPLPRFAAFGPSRVPPLDRLAKQRLDLPYAA